MRVEKIASAIHQLHVAVGASLKERPTAAAVKVLIQETVGVVAAAKSTGTAELLPLTRRCAAAEEAAAAVTVRVAKVEVRWCQSMPDEAFLDRTWIQRLKLKKYEPLSNFAFKINIRHCAEDTQRTHDQRVEEAAAVLGSRVATVENTQVAFTRQYQAGRCRMIL